MRECHQLYWQKVETGELWIQQCDHCQSYVFYPRSLCPYCLEPDLKWIQASGRGRVYSYTVVHISALPEFIDETPYVYAIIELDEGVRMPGTVIDCRPEEVYVGMPVQVRIIERKGRRLPAFMGA